MSRQIKLKIYEDNNEQGNYTITGRLLGAVNTEEANHITGNTKIATKVSTSESKSLEDTQKALVKGIDLKNEEGSNRIVVAIQEMAAPDTGLLLPTLTRQLFISDKIDMVKESHVKPGRSGSTMTLLCQKEALIMCEEE